MRLVTTMRLTTLLVLALTALVATVPLPASSGAPSASPPRVDKRPNIVLITSDDQTVGELGMMPRTRRLMQGRGTRMFGLSPHPLCCPARAEILTGQFAQNNGVYSNKGPHGGDEALDPRSTIATWLQDAGYRTAFLGKYLNGYDAADSVTRTPGWNQWHTAAEDIYGYTDFTLDENGQLVRYTDSYITDVQADLSLGLIRSFARRDKPFFMWQSFIAPHNACPSDDEAHCWGPPVPAPRHAALFPSAEPPSFTNPAFDEADVSDKPQWVQERPVTTPHRREHLRLVYRQRLQSLQAVDEAVSRTIRTLRRLGELNNTLIVFTSDNGYLLGEHRYFGKNVPYEQALRVPFLIRGPGVPRGTVTNEIAATVDIAPTFAAAAGVRPGLTTDGRNLLKVLDGSHRGWETLLVQAGANPPRDEIEDWFFRGVRTSRYTYVTYEETGEEELYDRVRDPAQLTNVASTPRYREVRREMAARLRALDDCAGRQCRQRFGPPPPL